MSAFVPQQPNAPAVGPYRNAIAPRLFGTTADDIRRVKKEAAEEDYSQFLTSDTQYMDYKLTNQEIVYFENIQKSAPNYMRLKLPQTSYPLRCDSAYFIFQVDAMITIPKNATEGAKLIDLEEMIPTFFKFWKMLSSYEISVGSNGCVITNSEQDYHYQNRIMSLITKPVSQSNLSQEYAGADIFFQYLTLDNKKNSVSYALRRLLWKIYKVNSLVVKQSATADVTVRIPLVFQIPLTMLHPLYNVNSIVPPGLETTFTFKFREFGNLGKYFFTPSPTAVEQQVKTRLRTAASRCFLYIEQPRRYPEILRSLKVKSYYNDFIMERFQRMDFTVNSGSQYVDKLVLIPPGGNVPVRIDWIMYDQDSDKIDTESPFNFIDVTPEVVESVKFLVHFPFPYQKEIKFQTTQTSQTAVIYPPSTSEASYHSEDNFEFATYGNQHVSHGVYPQIQKMEPLAKIMNYAHVIEQDKVQDVIQSENAKASITPNSVLILPSDQLNQNPYPRVSGNIYMSINFKEPMTENKRFIIHLNYYYWYRIHQENGKCSFLPIDDLGVKLDQADRP